ncbi:MAG: AmmeMemoRadiSam system protein A [Deltaproteobacteria bacterium]|nr:AmmeMemoRadiSam system protein A [Deltaproteobacteria bacterium]
MQAEDKKELLQIARQTLELYLKGEKIPVMSSRSPMLGEKRGAFVTLEKKLSAEKFQLRGCIGHLPADKPLIRVVQEMAIQAATGDPRFSPMTLEELGNVRIEISILSPFQVMHDISEIRIGEHGLLIEKGWKRGLLLPQVAEREGWDRETFLDYTCLKAGLSSGDWRSKEVVISLFSAEVFHEGL